jgi:hypothetical protein
MNIPATLEFAMAETLRAFAPLVGGVRIRTWQRLENDSGIDKDGSRDFPMIDIRATAPATDDNQVTCYSDIAIICATHQEDDRQHNVIRELYQGVQETVDAMYSQFRASCTPTDGTALDLFLDTITADTGATWSFGGLTLLDGLAPYDDGGRNMIGISIRVHYSRSDW